MFWNVLFFLVLWSEVAANWLPNEHWVHPGPFWLISVNPKASKAMPQMSTSTAFSLRLQILSSLLPRRFKDRQKSRGGTVTKKHLINMQGIWIGHASLVDHDEAPCYNPAIFRAKGRPWIVCSEAAQEGYIDSLQRAARLCWLSLLWKKIILSDLKLNKG